MMTQSGTQATRRRCNNGARPAPPAPATSSHLALSSRCAALTWPTPPKLGVLRRRAVDPRLAVNCQEPVPINKPQRVVDGDRFQRWRRVTPRQLRHRTVEEACMERAHKRAAVVTCAQQGVPWRLVQARPQAAAAAANYDDAIGNSPTKTAATSSTVCGCPHMARRSSRGRFAASQ